MRLYCWEMEPYSNDETIGQIRAFRSRVDGMGVVDPVKEDCDQCSKFEKDVLEWLESVSVSELV